MICSDDGSIDDSMRIISRFARNQKNVRFIRGPEENIGFSKRINLLLQSVETEYVTTLNSDDRVVSHSIQYAITRMRLRNLDFIFGPIDIIDSLGKAVGHVSGIHETSYPYPGEIQEKLKSSNGKIDKNLLLATLVVHNWVRTSSNVIARKSSLLKIGGMPQYHYCSDWAMALRLVSRFRGEYFHLPIIQYRVHKNNTISHDLNQSRKEVREMFNQFLLEDSQKFEGKTAQILESCLQTNPYLTVDGAR